MEARSSTSLEDASGATPGRVTVHCWSSVWSLTDYDSDVSKILYR